MDEAAVTRYVRYARQGRVAYGMLEGEAIHELAGDLFAEPGEAVTGIQLSEVKLLAPCVPSKVIAVGLNYRSHLEGRPEPNYPGVFAKLPSSVIGPDDEIVMPPDAADIHYEGELVVVIGKPAKNIPVARAAEYVFGVTAGNDVSERNWQHSDLQWLRAKASDGFAPVGPAIAAGLNHNDLLIQTRLNGELRQSERTSDLIFDVETIVAYLSRYVTLLPGDLIFTGTPGTTAAMQVGDAVEVEIEGVGTLRNTVTSR